jgi:beta-mannanase
VHDLFVQEGATNAVWVWVMTGAEDNLDNAAALWPGNDVVDWISWNVYNQSGCKGGVVSEDKYVSFADKMRVFYDFVHQKGPSLGMDPDKPMMISETGSVRYPKDMARTADWYASIPSVLEQYPQIKAVTLWASVDAQDAACSYTFYDDPTLTAGVQHAVTTGAVNQKAVKLP